MYILLEYFVFFPLQGRLRVPHIDGSGKHFHCRMVNLSEAKEVAMLRISEPVKNHNRMAKDEVHIFGDHPNPVSCRKVINNESAPVLNSLAKLHCGDSPTVPPSGSRSSELPISSPLLNQLHRKASLK